MEYEGRRTKPRSCANRVFWIIVMTIAAIVLILLVKLFFSTGLPNYRDNVINTVPTNLAGNELCLTKGCVITAAEVLKRMDDEVDPCDNFFKFACGRFIEGTDIPEDKVEVNVFSMINDKLQKQIKKILEEPVRDDELQIFQNIKTLYRNCMDTDKIEELGLDVIKRKIAEFGGWPVLMSSNWSERDFDWKELAYKFEKNGYSSSAFVELDISTDIRNNSRRIIYIETPDFGLSRDLLMKGKSDKAVKAYYNYMIEMAVLFGADEETAPKEMADVLDFEIALANRTLTSADRRNISKLYNSYAVGELGAEFPSIPWLAYINTILAPHTQVGLNETVVVTEPKYVRALEKILSSTPKRTQANYLFLKIVTQCAESLTRDVLRTKLKLRRIIHGIRELPPRWNKCVNNVKSLMSNLVGALYVRRFFNQNSKVEIINILKYIREEFDKILKKNDWMDKRTKQKALDKSAAITEHIAYPDELLDDELLTEVYGGIIIPPGEYHTSVRNVFRFRKAFDYRRLREPVNKTEWISHGNTAVVNAFYNHVENAIIFPAGILQGHFFDLDRPRYMNFGAFGSVIGHEITHGFDDVGRQFDKDGNLNEWWEVKTKTAFLEKANCMIEQYGNYTVEEIDAAINGKNTQGENIADNGGIKESYFAYQSWQNHNKPEQRLPGLNYTPNQMYWISVAQTWCHKITPEALGYKVVVDNHSPQEYRVVVPLGNIKEFSLDFKCPLGSNMNPHRKCKVW